MKVGALCIKKEGAHFDTPSFCSFPHQPFVFQTLAIHRQKIDYALFSLFFATFHSGYLRYKIQQCLIYNAAKLHT